ncbi:hypothetical protein HU200_063389 [Digitaria exilis]|uniref:Uncharacterized protein n=1 Tax=Digitaria exilis TaxID=1010633 RepID=A0A835ABF2_9POAL|nr:hypothetical protein HU200_063389 [Digitaria exilis]
MASSGDGGRELAVSGHGEPAALAVSGHDERAALAVSGHGERAAVEVLDCLDYPCTARLRFRRLLGYLRENTCGEIYSVARARLGVIFHVEDLVEQVKEGKLREASNYVRIYAPFEQSSDEAELLVSFLNDLMAISSFAEGDIMVAGIVCDWFKNLYKHPLLSKYPCFASLVADVLFLRPHHVRNSLDWQLVRNKAAELVEEMAYKAPELRDATHYPRGQNNLYE